MDSYTIGRENFGMEKEFIIEVVQNCPNPACRYYKTQLDLSQHAKQSNYMNSSNSSGIFLSNEFIVNDYESIN